MYLIYIIAFGVLLFVPIVEHVCSFGNGGVKKYQFLRDNQRANYQGVKWTFPGIVDYLSNLENWYNDNFGLKNELVYLNTKFYKSINVSPDSRRVIWGANGFLFAGDDINDVLSKSIGRIRFNEEELNGYYSYLLEINRFCKLNNIKFYLLIPPNKHTVYKEYLPNYYRTEERTNYDQLIKLYEYQLT